MPDSQNGDTDGCYVVDNNIGMDSDQFPRAVCPTTPTLREFGETFSRGSEAKSHAPGCCRIKVADIAADCDQVINSCRSEDYFHDGAGRSSGVPQVSSQCATSRRGIVCPAAACARASATARVSASSSVGSKTVAGSAMNYLHPEYKRRPWVRPARARFRYSPNVRSWRNPAIQRASHCNPTYGEPVSTGQACSERLVVRNPSCKSGAGSAPCGPRHGVLRVVRG